MDKLSKIRHLLESATGSNDNAVVPEATAPAVVINGDVFTGPVSISMAKSGDLEKQTERIVGRIEGLIAGEGKAMEAAFSAVLQQRFGVQNVADLDFQRLLEVVTSFNRLIRSARMLASV